MSYFYNCLRSWDGFRHRLGRQKYQDDIYFGVIEYCAKRKFITVSQSVTQNVYRVVKICRGGQISSKFFYSLIA